jgi:4-amino-4-deoxy-L-arabinose transferase-like glycosyltransferase
MSTKYLLIAIIAIGFILRFYQLGEVPIGFHKDEAFLGYNAYSILKTGNDEYGNFLPIAFTSFGDFKPPLYFYLTVPFIVVFGISEFAVRFPSAIFGILTVLTLFLLVQKLFNKFSLSALSALLLALSPWHIHYSRGGWETNLFTFLLTLGVYLFTKITDKSKWLYFSAIIFALSFYSYQGARLVMPILVLLLAIYFKNQLLKIKKDVILAAILGLIIIMPAIYTFFAGPGLSRFSGVSIFADSGPFWQVNERRGQHPDPNSIIVKILHNKVQAYGLLAFKNYFAHYDFDFLFINGDSIPRNKIVEHGTLLLFLFPFLIMGSFFLFSQDKNYP